MTRISLSFFLPLFFSQISLFSSLILCPLHSPASFTIQALDLTHSSLTNFSLSPQFQFIPYFHPLSLSLLLSLSLFHFRTTSIWNNNELVPFLWLKNSLPKFSLPLLTPCRFVSLSLSSFFVSIPFLSLFNSKTRRKEDRIVTEVNIELEFQRISSPRNRTLVLSNSLIFSSILTKIRFAISCRKNV